MKLVNTRTCMSKLSKNIQKHQTYCNKKIKIIISKKEKNYTNLSIFSLKI
jgi:hypothetical protein